MAACRQLARDTTRIRQYRPADCTALASTVAGVTIGPVAAWSEKLLPHISCRDTRPCKPAATHTPTAPLTPEHLYVVTAALLADGRESFVHHHSQEQIAGSIQGLKRDAPPPGLPHSASAPASGTQVAAHPLPGLSRGKHWCCRRRANRPSCTATAEGTGGTSWLRGAGPSGTAPPGRGHSRLMSTGSRSPSRPTI